MRRGEEGEGRGRREGGENERGGEMEGRGLLGFMLCVCLVWHRWGVLGLIGFVHRTFARVRF